MTAHGDVQAQRVPRGSTSARALSVLDPTQAPPGQAHGLCLACHAAAARRGRKQRAKFDEEFADKIIETWARYAPKLTGKNVVGRHVYTAYEYVSELPNMRGGDIFMGAFSADQVMYNHFGYRTPIRISTLPAHPPIPVARSPAAPAISRQRHRRISV